ncbi:acyl carrier protein [Mesorhizobium carmichaelinearum]|uniref:acyl carrier protein n=1 Tax=Mesorhizobium carmichaelinearum TaxID=1208188 RepID=UPI000BA41DED|nr:acyl carrier protein [Mesorhizobium carmichaelinearum]
MADQLTTDVIARLQSHPMWGGGEITSDTTLSSLGIDSLGLTDIMWELEQAYAIKIELSTAEAWSDLQKVSDLVDAVRGLIAMEV